MTLGPQRGPNRRGARAAARGDQRVAEDVTSPGRGLGQDSALSQTPPRAHLLGVMPPLAGSSRSVLSGGAVSDAERLEDGIDGLDRGDDAGTLPLPRHREHLLPGRPHRLRISYSPAELAAVRAGAARAGLTLSGFVAAAALAVARGETLPAPPVAEQAVAELARAHAQVRRIGVNLNQAAAKLNSGQTPPVWLERAVALAERALLDVQTAAAQLHEPRHSRRGPARSTASGPTVRLGLEALGRPDR